MNDEKLVQTNHNTPSDDAVFTSFLEMCKAQQDSCLNVVLQGVINTTITLTRNLSDDKELRDYLSQLFGVDVRMKE